MARILVKSLLVGVCLLAPGAPAHATCGTYEPTRAVRVDTSGASHAATFHIEFLARIDPGKVGHSYVALTSLDAAGHVVTRTLAGFIPKGADDECMARFAVPVAGMVETTRSDHVVRPVVRYRLAITRGQYLAISARITRLARSWTTYQLLYRNCNTFAGEIARVLGLKAPEGEVVRPSDYVATLRELNS